MMEWLGSRRVVVGATVVAAIVAAVGAWLLQLIARPALWFGAGALLGVWIQGVR